MTFICKYCGKECKNSNSLRNHERLCKNNPTRQISSFVKYNKECSNGNRTIWNKGLTKETDNRILKQSNTIQERFKNGELVSSFKGKHHTDESKLKLSNIRKSYLEQHPEMVPYKINHHSKQSYPEKYFRELFDNDEILKNFISEYKVGLYSLDFALPSLMYYIEIDGEQHYVDDRIIKHDEERNKKLSELGWKGIRIRWSDYQKLNLKQRKAKIQEIKDPVAQLVEHLTSSE